MAYADLGRLVKQKYPGSYDDISDDELGRRTLSKYPQYADIVGDTSDPTATAETGQSKSPLGERVANAAGSLTGTRQLGRAIGQAATDFAMNNPNLTGGVGQQFAQAQRGLEQSLQTTSELDKQLIQRYGEARRKGDTARAEKIKKLLLQSNPEINLEQVIAGDEGFAKPSQVAGSAVQSIATIGTFGLAPGSTLLGRAGQTAALSGVTEAGRAIEDGTGAGDVLRRATIGALTGAGTNVGLERGSAVLRRTAANRATKLYDNILGTNKADVKAAIKGGKPTIGQRVVERGGLPVGSRDKIKTVAEGRIDELEKQIQPLLKSLDKRGITIPTQNVVAPLEQLQQELVELGEPVPARLEGIIAAIKAKGDTLTPSQANALKRDYYSLLRGKKANFNVPFEELQSAKQVWRTAANALKTELENAAPRTRSGKSALRLLNAEQGYHLELVDRLDDAIAAGQIRDVRDIGKWFQGLLSTGSIARSVGPGAVGAVIGGVPGAALSIVGERVASSPVAASARARANTRIAQTQLDPQLAAILRRLVAQGSNQIINR